MAKTKAATTAKVPTFGDMQDAVTQSDAWKINAARIRDRIQATLARPTQRYAIPNVEPLRSDAANADRNAQTAMQLALSMPGAERIKQKCGADLTGAVLRHFANEFAFDRGLTDKELGVMPTADVAAMLGSKPPPKETDGAYYLGDGKIQIGDAEPFTITPLQSKVVEALVRKRSATFDELCAACDTDEPHKVIERILRRHPELKPFLKRPGGSGKGNYSTTIVDRRPQNAR